MRRHLLSMEAQEAGHAPLLPPLLPLPHAPPPHTHTGTHRVEGVSIQRIFRHTHHLHLSDGVPHLAYLALQ